MKSQKRYTITETKHSMSMSRPLREYKQTGTLEELKQAYKYTLECGKSYEHEKNGKKINTNPPTIQSLVKNLENAKNNSAANGYSGSYFSFVEAA